MRILVAHNVPHTRNTGMARIMGFIHDEIASQGHSVSYFCSEDVPLQGRAARLLFPYFVWRKALSAARSGKPYNLINIHEPSGTLVTTAKGLIGNPIVVATSHGVERRAWELQQEALREKGKHPLPFLLPTQLTVRRSEKTLRKADHIFCLSDEHKKYILEHYHRGSEEVTRIYPGFSSAFLHLPETRDYSKCRTLLFAGTWIARKGIDFLVPAFEQLATRHPELNLKISGAGVQTREILSRFSPSLQTRIAVISPENDERIAETFASADAYLLPSLFEGTPLTLIEAMASGLPIVVSETCGMKDVIQHDRNGLWIPTRSPQAIVEAVTRLLQSKELRERLGKQAKNEALAKYTWKQVSQTVLQCYEELSG